MSGRDDLQSELLGDASSLRRSHRRRWSDIVAAAALLLAASALIAAVYFAVVVYPSCARGREGCGEKGTVVESEVGVVAADDGRCSEIGAEVLRSGGHALDAAVAAAACLGVVHAMSSGIGGGAFIVVRSADGEALAFDARETAPSASNQNMYENSPSSKYEGALSMGIPGELAGMHAAWSKFGKLPWRYLFQPAIKLAREGFFVNPYLAHSIKQSEATIMADPGLRGVFARQGKILQSDDICYNPNLADSLEVIANEGPEAFYGGTLGENFVSDVRDSGGILTMEDLRGYKIKITEPIASQVMGLTILGMPPPSSGTLGVSMVLNILESFGSIDVVKKRLLVLHRLVEAFKHMMAIRMNLGDPDFVDDVAKYQSEMLSPAFASTIKEKIIDNATFEPEYYLSRWRQLRDRGTSHLSIVDADRNAVSMTTTVNDVFGAGVLSPSTGIVLNNEMDDFSTPTEVSPDKLPPAPANFIVPKKRPLSSMTPLIVVKDHQLAGVIGGSGGIYIIPAVAEIFLNHFIFGMDPLSAVKSPRVYHKLIPNQVLYENWTTVDGEHFEVADDVRSFLEQLGHRVKALSGGSVCQIVTHNLGRRVTNTNGNVFHGKLTAVSDPRKDGRAAAL